MNLDSLYKRLDSIFQLYTTHNWKNGWHHEADIHSKELTVQKEVMWHNMFLLQRGSRGNGSISLEGTEFKFEVERIAYNNPNSGVRIHIEHRGVNLYYHLEDKSEWQLHEDFIVDLCQETYDSYIRLREKMSVFPRLSGESKPNLRMQKREQILNEIGI